ncbi:hypothetical protein [Photobacterium damselae]|uniref:hypothetical protein n=1 Tax=Photobacterium damselae TaxID=38293 RepID=UPI0011B1DC82|nr:hypothetical protein [Photobacterium damselae]
MILILCIIFIFDFLPIINAFGCEANIKIISDNYKAVGKCENGILSLYFYDSDKYNVKINALYLHGIKNSAFYIYDVEGFDNNIDTIRTVIDFEFKRYRQYRLVGNNNIVRYENDNESFNLFYDGRMSFFM